MKWLCTRLLCLAIVMLDGCKKDAIVVEDPSEGQAYLNSIVDLMEKNSAYRDTINWTAFREKVFQKAPNVKVIAQTSQAIQLAIKLLNDRHSFYEGYRYQFYSDSGCPWRTDSPDVITPPGIGYVRISAFDGRLEQASNDFVNSLHEKIRSQDRSDLKGWIVDLRGNFGGSMFPMIAGIGPLLDEAAADHLYIIDQDHIDSYGYKNGKVYYNGTPRVSVSNPYTLLKPNPKVAVLIDGAASAGEATLITFIGRPATRLFGAKGSCGSTTAIAIFNLSDGAQLGIAHSRMADRNKKQYPLGAMPDQISKDDATAVAAAIEWLMK